VYGGAFIPFWSTSITDYQGFFSKQEDLCYGVAFFSDDFYSEQTGSCCYFDLLSNYMTAFTITSSVEAFTLGFVGGLPETASLVKLNLDETGPCVAENTASP